MSAAEELPEATVGKSASAEEGAPPKRRGCFVAVEGIDCSGKTTLCAALTAALREKGWATHQLRFPRRDTEIGKVIDRTLRQKVPMNDQAMHLLMSANRWEEKSFIEEKIAEGTTIVADRYCYSGIAYSLAKGKPGMDFAWCVASDVGLPRPDIVIFLDLPADVAAQRGSYGSEVYERVEFQEAVARAYDCIPSNGAAWVKIDAALPAEEILCTALSVCAGPLAARACTEPLGAMRRAPPSSDATRKPRTWGRFATTEDEW